MIKFLNRKEHEAFYKYIEYNRNHIRGQGDSIRIEEMFIRTGVEVNDSTMAAKEYLELKFYDWSNTEKTERELRVEILPLSVLFNMVASDLINCADSFDILKNTIKELGIDDISKLHKWGISDEERKVQEKLNTVYSSCGTDWKPV